MIIMTFLITRSIINQGKEVTEVSYPNNKALTDQEIIHRERLKLVKNRESAKNSRKRKKMYVDLLENKVNP